MSNPDTQAPTPGQPIPNPPDFLVVWDDPRDAKLTWMSYSPIQNPNIAIDPCRYWSVHGRRQCWLGAGRSAV